MVGDTVNVSGQSNCTPVKVPECRLSEDLGSLFDRSAFSDVMLCVGGREFLAHKAVLAGKKVRSLFHEKMSISVDMCAQINLAKINTITLTNKANV